MLDPDPCIYKKRIRIQIIIICTWTYILHVFLGAGARRAVQQLWRGLLLCGIWGNRRICSIFCFRERWDPLFFFITSFCKTAVYLELLFSHLCSVPVPFTLKHVLAFWGSVLHTRGLACVNASWSLGRCLSLLPLRGEPPRPRENVVRSVWHFGVMAWMKDGES